MNKKFVISIVFIAAIGFGAGWLSKDILGSNSKNAGGYDGAAGQAEFNFDLSRVHSVSMFTTSDKEFLIEPLKDAAVACSKIREEWKATEYKGTKRDKYKYVMEECIKVENRFK
jgi:hypothetical protein